MVWHCKICTFINNGNDSTCQACSTPEGGIIPDFQKIKEEDKKEEDKKEEGYSWLCQGCPYDYSFNRRSSPNCGNCRKPKVKGIYWKCADCECYTVPRHDECHNPECGENLAWSIWCCPKCKTNTVDTLKECQSCSFKKPVR